MRTRNPEESEDESAPDTCPVPLCRRDLDDDGNCPEHGGETEWRALAAESRASTRSGYEL